ncbi:MAG: S-layer homology domain-containing protein [Firmicutes bacterium]|nr:S-layer homology domain-containing protein [Bacillota bacterium]
MKNRTLICSVIIIAAQLCSISCYAYTKVTQSGTNDTAVIKADGYSIYEAVPVMILKTGKTLTNLENATKDTPTEDISDVVGYMGSLSADKDGNVNNEIDLTAFATGNTYGIVVNGVLYNLKYVTNAYRNSVISDMIYAADNDDLLTLQAKFSANKDCLSIDNNILDVCSSVSDSSITAILMTAIKGKGTLTIDQMSEIINKAMLTAALNANKVSDKEIVDHILADGQYDTVNSALKDKIKLSGLNNFIARINNQTYTNISGAESGIAKELILNAICYPKAETTSEIQTILENYNSILGLDLTKFNGLSSENKGNAIRNFATQKPTLATMQSVLDSIVAPLLKSSETQIPSGGGGGGGSFGGGSVGAFIGMQNGVFNDVGGYSWAQEAITSLYSAGIISGYGNGNFAPQNNIKREEFVTIAVCAFYKDGDMGTYSFSDVSEYAWYYKNIAIAANYGIISGMGENLFGVGRNITRQDMAVILCRIAGDRLKKPENYNVFSDDGDIANYAKEAVYALRAAGVINGVSTSEFAPKKNATRAETAVMVYRFLSIIGKEGV